MTRSSKVLTEHLRPRTVLDVFYQEANDHNPVEPLPYQTKQLLLNALGDFLTSAALSEDQVERIKNYAAMTQSVSQVDVFRDYLASFEIEVTRSEIEAWRNIGGGLVHAAEANAELASMRRFREVIRSAVLKELKRAIPDNARNEPEGCKGSRFS